jgi:hypothetical protein
MIEETLTRSDGAFISCPGFPVRGDFDVRRTVTTFYDDAGLPVRIVGHIHFSGSLTNTLTGKSIADQGNQIVTQDLRSGETTVVGPVRVETVPGEGVILADVGRIVRDRSGQVLFVAGQQDRLLGDIDDFCAPVPSPPIARTSSRSAGSASAPRERRWICHPRDFGRRAREGQRWRSDWKM